MMDRKERRGLGRGLSALMADVAPAEEPGPSAREAALIPVDRIAPNPDQPRRSFPKAALEELAQSIREKGIIQPLLLRPDPGREGGYQIVAGERRWRAAQIARRHDVPAIVRTLTDVEVLELSIIENIQRSDFNPIEEASGYRQLMDHFGHTQEQLSEALGKSRSHIANMLRLLTLPADIQTLVAAGTLSAGHGRALVTAENPVALALEIQRKGLSVRQTERLAKAGKGGGSGGSGQGRGGAGGATKDADTRALESDLMAILRMPVSIAHQLGEEGGTVTLRYASLEQLDELCQKLAAATGVSLD